MSESPQHRAWRVTEPIHAMIYFAPEAPERYARLGVGPQDGYFASRAAAEAATAWPQGRPIFAARAELTRPLSRALVKAGMLNPRLPEESRS